MRLVPDAVQGACAVTRKQGKHGTLFLWRFMYSPNPELCAPEPWTCWAYDAEHARERWDDTNGEDGWELVSGPVRVRS